MGRLGGVAACRVRPRAAAQAGPERGVPLLLKHGSSVAAADTEGDGHGKPAPFAPGSKKGQHGTDLEPLPGVVTKEPLKEFKSSESMDDSYKRKPKSMWSRMSTLPMQPSTKSPGARRSNRPSGKFAQRPSGARENLRRQRCSFSLFAPLPPALARSSKTKKIKNRKHVPGLTCT